MLQLVKIQPQQAQIAMDIIEDARAYLKATGINQWQAGYPDFPQITKDIQGDNAYFITEENVILGYVYVDFAPHPAYEGIEGQWGDGVYGVIHRLTMGHAGRGRGLTPQVFALVEGKLKEGGIEIARVDALEDNETLIHVLQKNGFVHRGQLHTANGIRMAWDKALV
ncbi:GNAT family N-acetyltransferase [Bengtsoniella intestinalis]|uniref:GNAT family N-acetyltransferase n=1 Tax=Bengtsoniella intestinalis TaxID=3073143 RepID=UPI00391F40EB